MGHGCARAGQSCAGSGALHRENPRDVRPRGPHDIASRLCRARVRQLVAKLCPEDPRPLLDQDRREGEQSMFKYDNCAIVFPIAALRIGSQPTTRRS